jgi:hypothetical protein
MATRSTSDFLFKFDLQLEESWLFLNAVDCRHLMLVTAYLSGESIFSSEIIAVSSGESILTAPFTAQSSCKCKENSIFLDFEFESFL